MNLSLKSFSIEGSLKIGPISNSDSYKNVNETVTQLHEPNELISNLHLLRNRTLNQCLV